MCKNWLKIPNRLEKIVRKPQGGIFVTHTVHCDAGIVYNMETNPAVVLVAQLIEWLTRR